MRISRVEISNIKGVEHEVFEPGTVTIFRGDNGTGKSSRLDAITAPFEGGCDPNWLRGWPEKPERKGFVKLDITDDAGQPVATATMTVALNRDGNGVTATREILDPEGVTIPAPATFLGQLGDAWAVDPSAFLKLDTSTANGRKELIKKLLDVMTIRFERDELAVALGGLTVTGLDITRGTDLDGLAKARKYIEEKRRKVGTERDEADGAVATLRKSLPEGDETTDWSARARELEQERLSLTQQEGREASDVQKDANVERQATADDFQAKERALREEFQQKLSALETEKAERLRAVDVAEKEAIEQIRATHQPDHERIAGEIATARERATQQTNAQQIRESIKTFDQRGGAKACEYNTLTETLERLDELKKTKLDSLPIPGLSFEDGNVYVEGVVWEHVNTAKRFSIAMQLSSMRAGKLPFMVCEDAEHFSPKTWAEVSQAVTDAGFQLVAAVADAGPLTIEKLA